MESPFDYSIRLQQWILKPFEVLFRATCVPLGLLPLPTGSQIYLKRTQGRNMESHGGDSPLRKSLMVGIILDRRTEAIGGNRILQNR